MSIWCELCGFEARTAQGLAGHRRLLHAESLQRPRQPMNAALSGQSGPGPGRHTGEPSPGAYGLEWMLPFAYFEAELWREVALRVRHKMAERIAEAIWAKYSEDLLEILADQYKEELDSKDHDLWTRIPQMMLGVWKARNADDKGDVIFHD
ncbi:MAG: hypothetical protein ACE5JL_04275 [Dehalococcoidia bacterium]